VTAGRRILVVDDQPEILGLAETILAGDGFQVATALSGDQALDRIFSEPFDLILLDINMPVMDGWETLRLMKADESLAAVPVVMFSVKGEIRSKVHGMQLGAVDYITKPFTMDDLLGRVRKVLGEMQP
jgi:DNA-binding response OmpR family regulator